MTRRLALPALSLLLLSATTGRPMLSAEPPEQAALDIVLVLDNSGSMRQNDAQGLMTKAASTLAGGLAAGSRLAVVLFDSRVDTALPLTGVDEPDFRARLSQALSRVTYVGARTDTPAAMERAIYMLREDGRSGARRVAVLFTDGVIDTGDQARDVERTRWLRDNLAPEARRLSVRVFGVAFTESADFQLIQSLAQTTDGEYFRVLAADEIAGVFDRIRARAVELAAAPAQAPGQPPPPGAEPARWSTPVLVGVGLALAMLVGAVAYRRRARRPTTAAFLRDIGRHTGTEIHPLESKRVRVGRDAGSNDIVIPSETVSGRHAAIEFRDGTFYLHDLRSSNGTFLNGRRFSNPDSIQEVPLKHGDRIRFDAYEFEFVETALEGSGAARLADGADVSAGGTRLRGTPPAPGQAGQPDPARRTPSAGPRETVVKPVMCPNHPSWKASELCPECKGARCKSCMQEQDGRVICSDCAAKAANSAAKGTRT